MAAARQRLNSGNTLAAISQPGVAAKAANGVMALSVMAAANRSNGG